MFDFKIFTKELAEIISNELTIKASQFKNETIVGLALDCHPWHPVIELCLLTNSEQDQKAVSEWGKWSLADWKYFQISRTEAGDDWIAAEHLTKQMADYYSCGDTEKTKIEIFTACANALNSDIVKNALKFYTLDKDFEVFIADPDDPDGNNYCTKKIEKLQSTESPEDAEQQIETFAEKFDRLYVEMYKYYKGHLPIDNQIYIIINDLLTCIGNASSDEITSINANHHHNAYFRSAYIFMEENRYVRAIELFYKAMALDDKWPSNYINIGICLGKLGKFNEGIEILSNGLSKCPNNMKIINNRCCSYLKIGELEKAKDDAYTLIENGKYKSEGHWLLTILEYFAAIVDDDNFYKYLPFALKIFKNNPEELYENEFIKKVQNTARFKVSIERLETGEYDLPENLKEFEKEIRATEKAYIRIELKKTEPTCDTNSKMGGTVFFFPKEMEYPTDSEGNPMLFLAQINWAEVPKMEGYPESGLLQFFIGTDEMYGMNENDPLNNSNYRVIYHTDLNQEQSDLLDINFAEMDTVFMEFYDEYSMIFKKWKRPAFASDYKFEKLLPQITNKSRDDYWNFLGEIDEWSHKIGGYGNFTQEDMRAYNKQLDGYELLFQLVTDDGIIWGDSGVGHFFIKPADLKNKDFSKVWFHWDCC